MKSVWSLKQNATDWRLNVLQNGHPRPGFLRVSTPDVGYECRSIHSIGSAVHTVWSDGKYFSNTSNIGNASYTSDDKVCMTKLTAQIYNSGTGVWDRTTGYYITTDLANYFAQTSAISSAAVTVAAAPTAGAPGSGSIPAGTYTWFATEVTSFGSESTISTGVTVTSATDFTVRITKGTTANANAIYWRIYRTNKNQSDDAGVYKVVTLPIATTYYDDNLIPELMDDTVQYDYGTNLVTPPGIRFTVLHKGVLVGSGNSTEPNTVYFYEVSKPTDGMLAGYPDFGRIRAVLNVADGESVTALASIGRYLIVFTRSSIYEYFDLPWDDSFNAGKISDSLGTDVFPKVLTYNDRVYFLTTDGEQAACIYHDDTGSLVPTILNATPLHEGLAYYLTGTAAGSIRWKSNTSWFDPTVWVDPVNNRVHFGGEIKTASYTSSWDTTALNAQPQLDRQYVFYVLDCSVPIYQAKGTMAIVADVLAKRATYVQGVLYFADHQGVLYKGLAGDVGVGTTEDSYATATVTAASSTTITFTGTYSGVVAYGTPIHIWTTTTGKLQIRYARSYTSHTVVVDRAVTCLAGDIVMWGATILDLWSAVLPTSVQIEDAEFQIEPFMSDGSYSFIGAMRRRGASSGLWEIWGKLFPITVDNNKVGVGMSGESPQLRFILPCMVSASLPQAMTCENIILTGIPFRENVW